MRFLRRLQPVTAVLLALSILLGGLATEPEPAAAAVTGSPIYWGTWLPGAPYTAAIMDEFEASLGKGQSIVHWGQGWFANGTPQTFQTNLFDRVRKRGSIPMIDWLSWEPGKGSNQADFRLATIASGKYDDVIRQWANGAKSWGQPFFLRFDHEMNGNWQFPWAEQLNGNKPGDFVKAWRHVHDVFASVGATNATWVWCPNVSGSTTRPMSQLYPGDQYVDWICLDGYNQSQGGATFLGLGQVFAGGVKNRPNSYAEITKLAPNKPLMIGETGTSEQGGSKADWLSGGLQNDLPKLLPGVQAIVYFNWNAGDPKRDWPVDTSIEAKAAFAQAISSSQYAANNFAALPSGPIPTASKALAQLQARGQGKAPAINTNPSDPRYFSATHFRIDNDALWGYFQSRGGVDVFGYPVSRTFTFLGCKAQIFQREVAQVCADGSPRVLNLLDPGIFPYTQVNGTVLPPPDPGLKDATPNVDSPTYSSDVIQFVRDNAPDTFEGQNVMFGSTFFGLIGAQTAGVNGGLLDMVNLEIWGAPISPPMIDPNNANFVYQRYQRGIMHFDATTGTTRGLLLADYFKAVLTGNDLPPDLAEQAAGGPLYRQWCPNQQYSVCRPGDMPASDLTSAFVPQ
jgi:hypothetical protein